MEKIYFVDLAPDTVAINSASVALVATVACRLIFSYTPNPWILIKNHSTYLRDLKHVVFEVSM